MKKGDIILLPFPFTDLTGNKNRPALILSATDKDVTVAFITSQTKWKEDFDFIVAPTTDNGLKKDSLIRLGKLATLDKTLVIGRLGNLSTSQIHEVNQNLLRFFQLLSDE